MSTTTTKSWRDVVEIHPAADLFPLMAPDELKALGADIKKNGLRVPTIWWRDPATKQLFLLDGRNRLDAIEASGRNIVDVTDLRGVLLNSDYWYVLPPSGPRGVNYPDPYDYVISANIHRRHLTAEQKRDVIAKLLEAHPEKSDRQIAETAKASPTTVGTVRYQMESTVQSGQLPKRIGKDGKTRRQQSRTDRRQVRLDREKERHSRLRSEAAAAVPNTLITAWDKASRAQRREFIMARKLEVMRAQQQIGVSAYKVEQANNEPTIPVATDPLDDIPSFLWRATS
jgi:hypothetical protein